MPAVRRLSGCLSFGQPPVSPLSFGRIVRFCVFPRKRALFSFVFAENDRMKGRNCLVSLYIFIRFSFAQPSDFARFIRFSFGRIIRFCAFSGKRAFSAVEFDISAEKSAFFRSENAVSAKKEVLGSVGGVDARASYCRKHLHNNKIEVAANPGFPFGTPVANMGGDARTAGFADE